MKIKIYKNNWKLKKKRYTQNPVILYSSMLFYLSTLKTDAARLVVLTDLLDDSNDILATGTDNLISGTLLIAALD